MKKEPLKSVVKVENSRCECKEDFLHVKFSISNTGKHPIFFVDRVRRIYFDPETKILHLYFSDEGRGPDRTADMRREYSLPSTQAIEAGRSREVRAKFPLSMTRLVVKDDNSIALEGVKLGEATRVEIHLALDDKPIYFQASRQKSRSMVSGWGSPMSFQTTMERPKKAKS